MMHIYLKAFVKCSGTDCTQCFEYDVSVGCVEASLKEEGRVELEWPEPRKEELEMAGWTAGMAPDYLWKAYCPKHQK